MYFKFSELKDWGKRSGEGRRRIVRCCPINESEAYYGMERVLEICVAGCLNAAMIGMIYRLICQKAEADTVRKIFCVVMLFGFTLGTALGEVQHARLFQVLCGLGVVLSYVAEGLAFAGKSREVKPGE